MSSRFISRPPLSRNASLSVLPSTMGDGGGDGPRVLIVDDNEDAAEMLCLLLVRHGYHCQTARSGVEALHLAGRFKPQVVLLDIALPDMSGYEVAARLRQSFGGLLALIAVTGWGSESDRVRARDAGFDRHMTKPVEGADLRGAMAELLARAAEVLNDQAATG